MRPCTNACISGSSDTVSHILLSRPIIIRRVFVCVVTYKCTLCSDEEMLEVITRVVFAQSRHVVEDCAVREDNLETYAVCVKGVVLDEVDATCVGC